MGEIADCLSESLAGDELLAVVERHEPALAAEDAHLADVFYVDERTAMDAPEIRGRQPFLQNLQCLRRQITALRGHDLNQIALGLERQNFVGAQQEIFVAGAAHDLRTG